MDFSDSFLLILLILQIISPSSSTIGTGKAPIFDTLKGGSHLSVEKSSTDVLVSQNGVFSAGFYPVGDNAFCFATWYSITSPPTVVWMANRDQPVNGKASKLSLSKNGNLILKDGVRRTLWETKTVSVSVSDSSVKLRLLNSGNLVLIGRRDGDDDVMWESFDTPMDTLLPQQLLTKHRSLVSSKSKTNFSSGNYNLYFDNDNVLRLLYNVPETTSVYWPDPWYMPWQAGRSTYNSTREAVLDQFGNFTSSDDFVVSSIDHGMKVLRRLTLDFDGNLRLYSLREDNRSWIVTWQAISQPCKIHGICGGKSLCSYDHVLGRRCSCLPGYKVEDDTDWSKGCKPEFKLWSCDNRTDRIEFGFLQLSRTESFGFDKGGFANATFKECEKTCLDMCTCKGFSYKFSKDSGHQCYPKTKLSNGYVSPGFGGELYIKMPKSRLVTAKKRVQTESWLVCSSEISMQLNRTYSKPRESWPLKFLVWFAAIVAVLEVASVFVVWCFLYKTERDHDATAVGDGYVHAATGFRKYTYAQLKAATNGFRDEIGRGGGGVVYRAVLPDQRVAAVKRLYEANQGEGEFLAEVSTIGRLNHMNLIEMWGYCAERKHRLLVYEYAEYGSLADNLASNSLNWEKRFDVAVGTARGLAYLHEECLEWILHCDIKPQNILLDSDYKPKVADFGLSKLLNRGELNSSSFSRIRGTRGYMAPEWVYNLPINSKVDVYSYGIVVLEMVTGKSPVGVHSISNGGVTTEYGRLFPWVREKMNGAGGSNRSWIEEIVDPMMTTEYNLAKMERLVTVALKCVEEDKDSRPTMSNVVEMLLCNDADYSKMLSKYE